MATKLKDLEVTKVDFVNEGANQRADIKLFKKREPIPEVPFATADPEAAQVQISESALKRFFYAIGKKLGISTDAMEVQPEDVQKGEGAHTFGEKMTEVSRQDIADEMWRVCYALQSALQSILYDEELDSEKARSMMEESLSDFSDVITSAIGSWSEGRRSELKKARTWDKSDLEGMETFRDRLDEYIQKMKEDQGGLEEMLKIDKSKMTPEEAKAYDEIIKKYAVETNVAEGAGEDVTKNKVKPEENEDEIDDSADKSKKEPAKKSISDVEVEEENLYKGLHPLVAAELKALQKFRDDAETKELMDVAKKYEIIGKKPEELVTTLKSLRAAGGSAYSDMLSTLDAAVAMVNASGVFDEIGKSGTYKGNAGYQGFAKSSSEAKVDAIAKGYMEKDPAMSYTDAIAKAWENNPDLMAEYENESGF